MYELGYCLLLLLLCERKAMTFSKDNTLYKNEVFSRSKQVAAVTECTHKNFLHPQACNFLLLLEVGLHLDLIRSENRRKLH